MDKKSKMVGCYHWFNGHEFEQTLGDSEGQESLACCSPRGHRVGHNWATEQQQQTGKEEVRLSLFADDILHTKYPRHHQNTPRAHQWI